MLLGAVVVTHNRIELLKETISALRYQSLKPDIIVVIDNSSTDNTAQWLQEAQNADLTVISQPNMGSSGGQYTGIAYLYHKDCDFIWVMDDDTIPTKTAFEALIETAKTNTNEKIGFLCSKVLWTDNKPHTMNLPGYFQKNQRWEFIGWELFNTGTHQIDVASFVSIVFSKLAITELGLPDREYFLHMDDIEYTRRFKDFTNYYVAASIVHHKTQNNNPPKLVVTNINESFKNYYSTRNVLYFYKQHNKFHMMFMLYHIVKDLLKQILLFNMPWKVLKITTIAIFNGLGSRLIPFNPKWKE